MDLILRKLQNFGLPVTEVAETMLLVRFLTSVSYGYNDRSYVEIEIYYSEIRVGI